MDNKQPSVFLDVPVTEAERAQAKRHRRERDCEHDSSAALLPEPLDPPPRDGERHPTSEDQPTPLRFPSIRAAPVILHLPPSISQRIEGRQYAPITSINEEDEPDAIHLRELSERQTTDSGYLLPPSGAIPEIWTPIWLTQGVLGLFALVFAGFLIGLVLLWHYDERNSGFKVAEGTSHLAWSYAPTVIIVFVVAAWRMVDHHSKLAMPFDSLQNGPVKPSESLLVDYISKFQLVSLFEAFRNSHFAVLSTVTGFILLKVATVFATGLLVLLPSPVTLAGTAVLARGFIADSSIPSSAFDASAMSASPVYAYYGTKAQGMSLENGVRFNLAYAVMTVNSSSPLNDSAIISGEVDAFVPLMSCQTLDVRLDTPAIVNDTNADDTFATSSNISLTIPAGKVCDQDTSLSVAAGNPYTEILPGRQVNGTVQVVHCGSTTSGEQDLKEPSGLLFTITDMRYQQTLFDNATDLAGGPFTIASNVSRTLANMTNVFCKASYTVTRVEVTNDTHLASHDEAISVTLKEDAVNSTLPQISAWNATTVFLQSSAYAEAMFGDAVNDDARSDSEAMFTLMAVTHGSRSIESLMDADKLGSAAQDTYKGILSQYAHQTLRSARNSAVEGGNVAVEEQRLRVNDVSLWVMASMFGLLVLFCIALMFIAPRAVVPRDPSSIATIATILTRSAELNRLFQRQGIPSQANQKSALAGYEFGTAIATTDSGETSFKIVTSEGEPEIPKTKPNADLKWWLPVTARFPVIVLTLGLPLVIIVLLELIQRSSDRHNGFYTVVDNNWTEVYSHYIPGIVMLIVATMVNTLDFNVALFGPWTNLANSNTISRKSVLNHVLGRSPPFAFLQALRTRYLGALLSITAATLASVLTVLVSGLYYVQQFTINGPGVSLTQLDTFDLKWPNSLTTDNGAAAMVDLMMHHNFNYPEFTYDGLVFPKLSPDNSALPTNSLTTINGSRTQVLPAVRGNLKCEVLPHTSFNVTTEKAGSDSAYATDQAFVAANATLPDSCLLGGYQRNASFVIYEHNFELLEGGQATYAGSQLDLLFVENAALYGNYGETRGEYISDNPAIGCPSLAFTFGQFQLDSTDKGQVTSMICYQEIQGLDANVTFKPNSTTIDPNHPPIVHDGSIFVHDNPASTDGAHSFDFRIQNNLAQEVTLFNGDATVASNPSSAQTLDIYFQAVLNGAYKHDPASLTGQNHSDVLVDAINRFYRIYMAQVISINMRTSLENDNSNISSSYLLQRRQDSSTTNTIATTITTPRLVQDKNSKIALQILLGAITVLAALAWLTTKMRHVLPCNPCSLAGTMSLLAGSDLCHSLDDGICECCGKPRRRSFGYSDNPDHSLPESIHAAPDESGNFDAGHVHGFNSSDDYHGPGDTNQHQQRHKRAQFIPDGAEWLSAAQFAAIFGGQRYSMGWWRERRAAGKRRRFGVDLGDRADGGDDQDWELGDRRPQGNAGFDDFMVVPGGGGGGRGGGARGRGDRDGRGEYSRFSRFRNNNISRSRSRTRSRSGDRSGAASPELSTMRAAFSRDRGPDADIDLDTATDTGRGRGRGRSRSGEALDWNKRRRRSRPIDVSKKAESADGW
ncbi:hypothetical protein A1O1_02905 [Capronia coronata CBS 617.96]|uniref:Uncharacterized protein n=1 Tax=Capronia coronata CBS 617.96 TaxID=1182541 RepID=W9ZJ37_9EURO|nr:uncharacterized protein A1O1_02905 [Capronia coronata CBS 617.96]EXJ94509.1 hypothetical protein A1O1_02905 [Capronia coronata CBS 617.96]